MRSVIYALLLLLSIPILLALLVNFMLSGEIGVSFLLNQLDANLKGVLLGSILGLYSSCVILILTQTIDREKEERLKNDKMKSLVYHLVSEINMNASLLEQLWATKDINQILMAPPTHCGVSEFLISHHLYMIAPEILDIKPVCYIYEQQVVNYLNIANYIKNMPEDSRAQKLEELKTYQILIIKTGNILLEKLEKTPKICDVGKEYIDELCPHSPKTPENT